MISRSRTGFALLVTLWTIVGSVALAFGTAASARSSLNAARNRGQQTRAYWMAFGCLERARHTLHRLLWPQDGDSRMTAERWNAMDQYFGTAPAVAFPACEYALEPAGLRANVNTIQGNRLHRLVITAGISAARADSLGSALLDWRDADDVPRPLGAERDWYAARGLPLPRNAPLAAVEELRWVRGFDAVPDLVRFLGVDADRVVWTRAPSPVLASLPGMTPAALAVFENRRSVVTEIAAIGAFPEMPASAREELARAGPALMRETTAQPEMWDLTVSARGGNPAISVAIVARLVLRENRLVVARRVVHP